MRTVCFKDILFFKQPTNYSPDSICSINKKKKNKNRILSLNNKTSYQKYNYECHSNTPNIASKTFSLITKIKKPKNNCPNNRKINKVWIYKRNVMICNSQQCQDCYAIRNSNTIYPIHKVIGIYSAHCYY